MVSRKKQIIDELNKAEDFVANAELMAEAYPFVQDLLGDIIEKIVEVKVIVRGADEVIPEGQTNITESLSMYIETLEGE